MTPVGRSTSGVWVVAALGLGLAAGAAATYLALGSRMLPPTASAPTPPQTSPETAASASEPAILLSPDAVERAKIVVSPVELATPRSDVRTPAVIEPNAYRQVVITALVAGRMSRVNAELGQLVRRGDLLAEVYSPELAEAQRAYLSQQADLQAHEQQLARTERLVGIGATSRQELERAHAEHTMLTSSVAGARSRLELFSMSADQVTRLSSSTQMTSTFDVRAPSEGVVTSREATVGANVQAGSPLFTIANLSTVWVVGSLYEKDFALVRVGSPLRMTVPAYPGLELRGTVSYIDPQVNRETRTARVRAEMPNAGGRLRLGMYADLHIGTTSATPVALIPRGAVQTIGQQSVVYVADTNTQGRFVERAIQIGAASDGRVEVVSGLSPGELVVTEGSFSLRAERERQGLTASSPHGHTGRE